MLDVLNVPDVRADSRLAVPRLPAWHVPRPRLLSALDHAVEVPLVLISACPGAGKTVLLTEWARRGRYPVAWLCPAADDNAPRRFRNLLTSAMDLPFRRNVPSRRTTPVVPAQASTVDFVNSLLSKLPDNGPPLILVIDDAHVLTNPHICHLLDRLVVGDCARLRVVLAARSDPPLPLHRYRLAGQLCELRTADLAMTPAETRRLLDAHQVTLPEPALSTLIGRTEGWAAGLRLAAMRIQGAAISNRAAASARLVDEPGFGHGSVGEYLLAEAFEHQPERLRRLLVETSFLDELTGPLAEAVTGIDGCAEMLRELARSNSFVIALDISGTRFRYHRLFAEVLRQRQNEKALPELAARAAAWFEQNGDPEHALYWAAKAGNRQRASRALVHGGLSAAFAQQHSIPSAELSELLLADAEPATGPGVPTGPDAPLAAAALCAITGDVGTAARELAKARVTSTAQSREDQEVVHTAALVEFMLGMRSGDAVAVDAAALRLTGGSLQNPAQRQGRAAVLLAQATTHFWHGDHEDVDVLLGQALAAAQQDGLTAIAADTLAMIACVDSYRGRTRHADAAALRARCLLRQEPGLAVPPALQLAVVIRACAEADFTRASRALGRALTPDAVGADPALGAALDLWHASILGLSGNLSEAQAVLAQDAEDAPCPRFPLIEIHRDIILGEIDTSLGRPLSAVKRLERHREGKLAALAATSCARAHLALHDQKTAQGYTRRVLSAASAQLSRLVLVDAMLLEARIAHLSGNLGRALEMITNALDVAGDELVLPFGAAKASLAGLLARHPAVAARWPAPPSLGDTAVTGDQRPDRRSRPVLLTPREQAIARYLATSMSTAEIADEMYLSVNTVKTHLAGIYRKLGARKRRQALLRARELELLLAALTSSASDEAGQPFARNPVAIDTERSIDMRPETSGQTETSGHASQTDAAAQWSLAWRGPLLLGLVTVVLGLIVAARPTGSLNAIAVLLGVLMIVSGIYHLVRALDNEEHERVWRGIAGLLFIVTGVVLIRHLRLSLAVIGLIVGFTWIAQGVSSLLSGISGRPRTGAGWSVFFGVISLIAGIVVVSAPISSLGALTVLMGIWFVVMGVMEMLTALVIRRAVRQAMARHGGTFSVPGQRATEPEPRDSAPTLG